MKLSLELPVRPGVYSTRSLMSSRLTSRMNSPDKAVIASGTSDNASARRCTVTTISSITPWAAWACAGAAARVAKVAAEMERASNPLPDSSNL